VREGRCVRVRGFYASRVAGAGVDAGGRTRVRERVRERLTARAAGCYLNARRAGKNVEVRR